MTDTVLHASCVAVAGRALLIRGASGSGKSALALQLIALGATLVADDRTMLEARDGDLIASPPDAIAGRIEARGFGLLHVPAGAGVQVVAVVDLDRLSPERLPSPQNITLKVGGVAHMLPLFHKPAHGPFAAALLLYLRHEQPDPRPP